MERVSENGFNERLGDHLRRLRRQKGLSLLDVEAASAKEFKSSVLGAYERGERAISAARLARLAELYRLPLKAMIPSDGGPAPAAATSGIALDPGRLDASDVPEARAVARYVRQVQAMRQEWTQGPVIALRATDVRALAAALDRTPEELVRRLDELGVRVG
ncbi:MAG TPA: helix-turn-helix transcriptional regulator [Actinomycetota bacterium]|jgi:transcriptional regulator with XRE-family HTH domain|nr:helix-turn-helix transcriptional regulator [Actinomycetota bacterium]